MKIGARDRRALAGLGVVAVGIAIYAAFSGDSGQTQVVMATDSIAGAERRLARVRQTAATVPGKEQVLKQVTAELALREKGILQAETAAQAQAQLVQIVRKVARQLSPPLDLGNVDLGQQVSPVGDDYGEVLITVAPTCHIEDLVNFLAELTRQPEAIATSDLRITLTDPKKKTIGVRLTISGLVPRRLVPEKKGLTAF